MSRFRVAFICFAAIVPVALFLTGPGIGQGLSDPADSTVSGNSAVTGVPVVGTVRFLELFLSHSEVLKRFEFPRLRFRVEDRIEGIARMTGKHEKLTAELKEIEEDFVRKVARAKGEARKNKYSDPLVSNLSPVADLADAVRELEELYWKSRMALEKRLSALNHALSYGLGQEEADRHRTKALLNGEIFREVVSDVLGAIGKVSARRGLAVVLNDDPFLWPVNGEASASLPEIGNPYGVFLKGGETEMQTTEIAAWGVLRKTIMSRVPGRLNPGAILSPHDDITAEVAAELAAGAGKRKAAVGAGEEE